MERTIKGMRGCATRGGIDINDFSHCGDKECPGCNMMSEAFDDALKILLINNTITNGQK